MKECEQAKHVLGLLEKLGKLDKTAQDKTAQEITHKKLDASQPAIGNEMQKEIEEGCQGNYASDKSVNASIANGTDPSPKKVEGDDDKKAAKVLSETGTAVKDMYPCGTPAGTPEEVVNKSAALQFKTRIEAVIKAEMAKEAAAKAMAEEQKKATVEQEKIRKEAAAKATEDENVTTATEVLAKVASLNEVKTQEDFVKLASDIQVSFEDLRRTNPLFNIAVEHKMMEKMAAEIDALAAENGMSPEDAAAALDEATANDPEAAGEMQSEAEGEALSDLAGAEQDQAAFMDDLDSTAAQVSEMLGTEVTGDDIANAVGQVVDMAEELGVEPEVLLQAAVEEMTGGE